MIYIFYILLFLFFSFIFSASEMAFVSSDKIFIRIKSKKNKNYLQLLHFLNRPLDYLYTILISNNISNILVATMVESFLDKEKIFIQPFFLTFYISLTIMIFSEILPKIIVSKKLENFALIFYRFINFLFILEYPIIYIFTRVAEKMTGKKRRDFYSKEYDKETIKDFLYKRLDLKFEHEHEKEMITGIFKMEDKKAKDICTKRKDVYMINIGWQKEKIFQTIKRAKKIFTKIPVYDDSLDDIKGILNIIDVVNLHFENLENLIEQPLYVEESYSFLKVLEMMEKNDEDFAVVIDEYGGFEGVITKNDLFKTILGEIEEKEKSLMENILGYENGDINIVEFSEKYGLTLKGKGFTTLSGYLIYRLKRFPFIGDVVIVDNRYKIVIIDADEMVVKKVKIEEL